METATLDEDPMAITGAKHLELTVIGGDVTAALMEHKVESNLALGRPVSQSSVSTWSTAQSPEVDASGANNGIIDGEYGFHTDRQAFPWWQVDLGSACLLRNIRIFNRQECAHRLIHFSILSSLDAKNWKIIHRKTDDTVFGATDLIPYTATLPLNSVARFLRVRLDAIDHLHFCEFEAIGTRVDSGGLASLDANYQSGSADLSDSDSHRFSPNHSDTADGTQRESREFVIAGHSHMFALGASFSYAGPIALTPIAGGPRQGRFLMAPWAAGRGASYWDTLVKEAHGRIVILSYQGNQHFANFLFSRLPLFDFLDPADPTQSIWEDSVLVPRRLVKQSHLLMPSGLRELIHQLKVGGAHRIIVLGTPPVREDYVLELEKLRKEGMWHDLAAKAGLDLSICVHTPPAIMKRLWGVVQELLAEAAFEAGAEFLRAPKHAFDPNGYLAELCRGPRWNFTHANEEYGRLVMKDIMGVIARGN